MRPTNFPECGDVCYSPVEVLPGVWHIRNNYGELVFVTLLVGQERALLIDTAYGYGDLPGLVRSITPLPLTVVNTHGHSDHNGGNFLFHAPYMFHEDIEATKWSRCGEINEHVALYCPPEESGGFDEAAYLAYDPATTRPLRDGQVFDLGGMTVQVLHIGNHSPGSCALYCPERQLLVAGDAVAPAVCLSYVESCSVEEHIARLRALESLPFEHILSGHSDRLIPRSELKCYIDCAEHVDEAMYGSYRNSLMPSYRARMYYYTNDRGDTGIIILPKPGAPRGPVASE